MIHESYANWPVPLLSSVLWASELQPCGNPVPHVVFHVVFLCFPRKHDQRETESFLIELPIWRTPFLDDGIWAWLILGTIPYFQASPAPSRWGVVFLWSLKISRWEKHINNSSEWCIHNVTGVNRGRWLPYKSLEGCYVSSSEQNST